MSKNSKLKATFKRVFIVIGFSVLIFVLLIIVVAVILIYQNSNHNTYEQRGDEIYFIEPIKGFSFKLEGSDAASFESLDCSYGKDKNQAYYFGEVIEGVDAASFEVIKCYVARDKDSVYKRTDVIQGADPKTFEVPNDYYGKDKNAVYAGLEKAPEIDLESFEVISNRYGKDAQHVYYEGKLVPEANPNTFESFRYGYWKDGNRLYYEGQYLEGRDASTLEQVKFEEYPPYNRDFTRDSSGLYLNNQKLEGANPQTFELIDRQPNFARDDQYLFYKHYRIEGVDFESVEIIGGDYPNDTTDYLKDKNGAYFVYDELASGNILIPQKLEGADLETLEVDLGHFSRNYLAKTKDFIYFRGKKIEGIEPKGFWIFHPHYAENNETVYGVFQELGAEQVFVPLEDSEHWNFKVLTEKEAENSFAKDGKQVYFNGGIIPIEGVEVESVELLSYGFFKDGNRIYCQSGEAQEWKVLEGADAQSFEFIYNGAEYSRDEDGFFNYCEPIESLPEEVSLFVDDPENTLQVSCNHYGGEWKLFDTDCADTCYDGVRFLSHCGQVETYSCSCNGYYECWNGSACEERVPPSMGI